MDEIPIFRIFLYNFFSTTNSQYRINLSEYEPFSEMFFYYQIFENNNIDILVDDENFSDDIFIKILEILISAPERPRIKIIYHERTSEPLFNSIFQFFEINKEELNLLDHDIDVNILDGNDDNANYNAMRMIVETIKPKV